MWTDLVLDRGFFAALVELDEQLARKVAAAGCPHCGGPLHRADYERKPRGAQFAAAGEAFRVRFSLCCGVEGCRRRALPPSVRFLGRRVYLEVVVLVGSVVALLHRALFRAVPAVGVPRRTLDRWRGWWTLAFPASRCGRQVLSGSASRSDNQTLPLSWLDQLVAQTGSAEAALLQAAVALCPMTTRLARASGPS